MDRLMTGGHGHRARYCVPLLIPVAIAWAAVAFGVQSPDCGSHCWPALRPWGRGWWFGPLGVLGLCLAATTVPLFLIVGYLVYRGGTALNWDFFTQLPKPVGQMGGGMANAFYGSALMIGLATAFSVPVGLLAAIYLSEYRSDRLGPTVRFVAEMLGSVPSVVIGIFGYYLVVRPVTHNFSGLAGGFALGVMMIPIVMRASEECSSWCPRRFATPVPPSASSQWQTALTGERAGGLARDHHRRFPGHSPRRRRDGPAVADRLQQRLLAAVAQRLYAIAAGVYIQLCGQPL